MLPDEITACALERVGCDLSYPNALTKWHDLIKEKLSFRWSASPVMLSWTLPQSAIVD